MRDIHVRLACRCARLLTCNLLLTLVERQRLWRRRWRYPRPGILRRPWRLLILLAVLDWPSLVRRSMVARWLTAAGRWVLLERRLGLVGQCILIVSRLDLVGIRVVRERRVTGIAHMSSKNFDSELASLTRVSGGEADRSSAVCEKTTELTVRAKAALRQVPPSDSKATSSLSKGLSRQPISFFCKRRLAS